VGSARMVRVAKQKKTNHWGRGGEKGGQNGEKPRKRFSVTNDRMKNEGISKAYVPTAGGKVEGSTPVYGSFHVSWVRAEGVTWFWEGNNWAENNERKRSNDAKQKKRYNGEEAT